MRYLLDTNIAGAPLKPTPDPKILRWLDGIAEEDAALAAPVLGELLFGVQRLDPGRRQAELMARLRVLANRLPVLDFDARAAGFFAVIMVERARKGRPMQKLDAMIAAIARAHDLTLVSADARAFADGGVDWRNPLDL